MPANKRYKLNNTPKQCDMCDETFNRPKDMGSTTWLNKQTCSDECKSARIKKRRRIKMFEKYGANCLDDKPCETCKTIMVFTEDQKANKFVNNSTCSFKCGHALAQKNRKATIELKALENIGAPKKKYKQEHPLAHYWEKWKPKDKLLQQALTSKQLGAML